MKRNVCLVVAGFIQIQDNLRMVHTQNILVWGHCLQNEYERQPQNWEYYTLPPPCFSF